MRTVQKASVDLLQDLKSRLTDGADATTRSQKIAQETHTHLKDASVHNLDADQGDIEARYCAAGEDLKVIHTLIIAHNQQHCQYPSGKRPIEHLMDKWIDSKRPSDVA
ncbi:hypothetical protein FOFC_03129 [Fusarium oxysporum]|nr:hypothetical protein FOFC_03129 [Fusarium oxysporum]